VYDLISIGDTTADVFLQISHASIHCDLKKEACQLCVTYADKIPVEQVTEVLGVGNAANNAVGAVRLGLRTALWTILGNDPVGRRTVREVFTREGVSTQYIESDPRHRTNFSTVINFHGERTILVHHEPRTYRFPRLPSSWLVYLTSMGKGWEAIIPHLLTSLRRAGARLIFNPGTYQLATARKHLRSVLRAADTLIVNRDEARTLLGVPRGAPKPLLRGLLKQGPRAVVMTDGANGAYAMDGGEIWYMPVIPVRLVERTGAGDSFATGVLAARFFGKQLPDALLWGALNAASVIQYVGGREGLLSRATLDRRAIMYQAIRAKKLP
jgi:sugar/nucleoside kinase (ribokinase family)